MDWLEFHLTDLVLCLAVCFVSMLISFTYLLNHRLVMLWLAAFDIINH